MNFRKTQISEQIAWWKEYSNQPKWTNEKQKWGKYKGEGKEHIIIQDWKVLLWKDIQQELPTYIGRTIQPHSGVRNLLSSWVASANLYFPTRFDKFNHLLLDFLKAKISNEISQVLNVELEFALDGDLSPANLLGEKGGNRGFGQTSPDVAFIVKTQNGNKGLILVECKYTEGGFYRCSARTKKDSKNKPGNKNPERCMEVASSTNYETVCQQAVWGRKYLDYFKISVDGKKQLKRCPAATAGYQLVRQQALANGIKEKGDFSFVVSAVSFDERNQPLISCLSNTGVDDFQKYWVNTYEHGAGFLTWYHQDWVNFVRSSNPIDTDILDWLNYMKTRYGY